MVGAQINECVAWLDRLVEQPWTIMSSDCAASTALIWLEINAWADDWPNLICEIECLGLTVADLGKAFAQAFQSRKLWCRRHCRGVFTVESIRDARLGRDTGRRIRFSREEDAALFRLRWC
jgi:hypothetical protein